MHSNEFKEVLGDDWHYLSARPEPVVGQGMKIEFEEADRLYSPWYTSTVQEIVNED